MKKLFTILALMLVVFTANAQIAKWMGLHKKVATATLKGDANSDGQVTVADVMLVVNYVLGKESGTFNSTNADVNGDGEITIADVMQTVDNIIQGSGGNGGNGGGIGDTSQAYLTCPDDNHPHMIDLGLPSGTLWACCNVADDLSKQSPTYYGDYYAWGETSAKDDYSPVTYQYATGVDEDGDGYFDDWHEDTRTYGLWQNIGEDIAGTKYDVAHVKWGGRWRMPTMEQIKELIDNCTSERTFVYGYIDGRYFKNNGGSIFLCLTRSFSGTNFNSWGNFANYRSSTQLNYIRAYGLYYNNNFEDNAEIRDDLSSYHGYTVRPVWVP